MDKQPKDEGQAGSPGPGQQAQSPPPTPPVHPGFRYFRGQNQPVAGLPPGQPQGPPSPGKRPSLQAIPTEAAMRQAQQQLANIMQQQQQVREPRRPSAQWDASAARQYWTQPPQNPPQQQGFPPKRPSAQGADVRALQEHFAQMRQQQGPGGRPSMLRARSMGFENSQDNLMSIAQQYWNPDWLSQYQQQPGFSSQGQRSQRSSGGGQMPGSFNPLDQFGQQPMGRGGPTNGSQSGSGRYSTQRSWATGPNYGTFSSGPPSGYSTQRSRSTCGSGQQSMSGASGQRSRPGSRSFAPDPSCVPPPPAHWFQPSQVDYPQPPPAFQGQGSERSSGGGRSSRGQMPPQVDYPQPPPDTQYFPGDFFPYDQVGQQPMGGSRSGGGRQSYSSRGQLLPQVDYPQPPPAFQGQGSQRSSGGSRSSRGQMPPQVDYPQPPLDFQYLPDGSDPYDQYLGQQPMGGSGRQSYSSRGSQPPTWSTQAQAPSSSQGSQPIWPTPPEELINDDYEDEWLEPGKEQQQPPEGQFPQPPPEYGPSQQPPGPKSQGPP